MPQTGFMVKTNIFRVLFLTQLLLKDKRFSGIVDRTKLISLRTKITGPISKKVRAKTICPHTGRGRGLIRFVGVSRFISKRLIVSCQLPGIRSSS